VCEHSTEHTETKVFGHYALASDMLRETCNLRQICGPARKTRGPLLPREVKGLFGTQAANPWPHEHRYNEEFDASENDFTEYLEWKSSPLKEYDNL